MAASEFNDVPHVLVVDDDPQLTQLFVRALSMHGFRVSASHDGVSACGYLQREHVDAVVLDLEMEPMSGWEMLERLRVDHPDVVVLVLSGVLDVPSAVHAIRAGAFDVLEKPVRIPEVETRLREGLALRSQDNLGRPARPRDSSPRRGTPLQDGLERLLGHSPAIARVREQVIGIARFNQVATLIVGETGTGKEVVAEALHGLSAPGQPFVTINCAAIPETLFESELFGHEAGAFTGARTAKPGLLETAGEGTVLLDEVGEMAMGIQPKLLRVLQNRTFRRVGGSRDIELRARIVSATNRKLSAARQDGMRSDLYFRLAGFTIVLPPLRHRPEDVELLANRFLLDFSAQYPGVPTRIGNGAAARLLAHSWPGNVRELKRVVEQAAVLSSGSVLEADAVARALDERLGSEAPPPMDYESGKFLIARDPRFEPEPVTRTDAAWPSSDELGLNELQQKLILDAYEANARNLTRAARALRIPRTTLRDRLKRYGCL